MSRLPFVLLCDTNIQRLKQNQQVVSRYFQTEIAVDHTEAFLILKKKPITLAIVDKTMGEAFFTLCQTTYPNLWIIAISDQGTWTQEEADRLHQTGIRYEDIFEYPLQASELQEMSHALNSQYGDFSSTDSAAYQEIQQGQLETAALQNTREVPYTNPNEQTQTNQHTEPIPGPYSVQPREIPPSQPIYTQQQPVAAPPMTMQQSGYPYYSHPTEQAGQGFGMPYAPSIQKGLYAFYSPKGGVGKTSISTNMALAVTNLNPNVRVCLVDLDIFYGNVASLLKLNQQKPFRTILNWVDLPEQVDQSTVFERLMQHPSGLWVLPAPKRAIEEDFVTAEVVENVVQYLRHYFDMVFIDLGPSFKDPTVISFQYADRIFLVSDLDRMTLSDCDGVASELRGMGVPLAKVELLFNNVSGGEGITVKDASKILGQHYKVSGTFPSDPKVKLATNKYDVPIVLSVPKSPFSKAVLESTARLFELNPSPIKKKKSSIFSFFTRKKEGSFSIR